MQGYSGLSSRLVKKAGDLDEYEPISASFYTPGSALEKLLKGKKLSLVDWQNQHLKQTWMAKIVESFGFAKAEEMIHTRGENKISPKGAKRKRKIPNRNPIRADH